MKTEIEIIESLPMKAVTTTELTEALEQLKNMPIAQKGEIAGAVRHGIQLAIMKLEFMINTARTVEHLVLLEKAGIQD